MKNARVVVISVLIGMLIGCTTFVFANASVQAILNSEVKVSLDGVIQEFRDESTNAIQFPLTYRDRTYLPLRTVANLVGVAVDYDASTNTAILKTGENHIDDMKKIKNALLSEDWVKENLYLKNQDDVWHTDIWFEPMDNGSVFANVKSYYDEGYSHEYFLIYCKNGELMTRRLELIRSERISEIVSYQVDKENSIIYRSGFDNGTGIDTFYSIDENYDLKEIAYFRRVEYYSDLSERVYENGDLIIDYYIDIQGFTQSGITRFSPFITSIENFANNYNFVWVNTELNEENIDNTL